MYKLILNKMNYLQKHFSTEQTVSVLLELPESVHKRIGQAALDSSADGQRVTKKDKTLESIVRGLLILESEAREADLKEYEINK